MGAHGTTCHDQQPSTTHVATRTAEWRQQVFEQKRVRAQASILHYAASITSAASECAAVVDCVIVVPPFFGPAQRQALIDAAELAGTLIVFPDRQQQMLPKAPGSLHDFLGLMSVSQDVRTSLAALCPRAPRAVFARGSLLQLICCSMAWTRNGLGFPTLVDHFILLGKCRAGLNVMALVNSHAAAALQYGIERDFAGRTEWVVLYDMGATSTEAALVKFSSFSVREGGKPKTYRRGRAGLVGRFKGLGVQV